MTDSATSERQLLADPKQLLILAGQLLQGPRKLSFGESMLVIATALALALLADLGFNGAKTGINVPVWYLALVAGVWFCTRRLGGTIEPRRMVLFGASLVFATLLAIRAAPILQAFDLAAASGLLLLALLLPPRVGLVRIGVVPTVLALVAAAASLAIAPLRLPSGLNPEGRLAGRVVAETLVIGRALLLALPVFLIFGGLFVAADAVFESKARDLLSFDLDGLPLHAFYLVGGFWVAVAAIWSGAVVELPDDVHADLPDNRRLRTVETMVLLVPLVLLFFAFVVVQLRYLFGGSEVVLESVNLTYSQYARRGFFELVVASSLLLPILLAVNWARRRDRISTVLYKSIALILVGLLFVVMASAWKRLDIYTDTLGLTELRFYAAVILAWLMMAFVWFCVCLLRLPRDRFLGGIVIAAVLVLVCVNALNPDALIARTNTSRLEAGRSFDALYAAGLSADAAPTLVDRLDRIAPPDRCLLAQALLTAWSDAENDPRSFNLGRLRAHRAVAKNRAQLEDACR